MPGYTPCRPARRVHGGAVGMGMISLGRDLAAVVLGPPTPLYVSSRLNSTQRCKCSLASKVFVTVVAFLGNRAPGTQLRTEKHRDRERERKQIHRWRKNLFSHNQHPALLYTPLS
jgi:hypothetical protein